MISKILRRGQLSNRESMRRLVGMLSSLGLYITRFEGPFLQVYCYFYSVKMIVHSYSMNYMVIQDSIRFFKAEGQLLMESSSPSVFMQV